jgi:hypothetical protein
LAAGRQCERPTILQGAQGVFTFIHLDLPLFGRITLDPPINEMANGKWQMANGKWQMANGKWQMADGRWHIAPVIPASFSMGVVASNQTSV